jgi:hypothetical protein
LPAEKALILQQSAPPRQRRHHGSGATARGLYAKSSDLVVNHYGAGRLNLDQYLTICAKYGYLTSITLYQCGTSWTNLASCGPLK